MAPLLHPMKLRDLILRDFRLKLFSLLIAWLLWETIHLGTRSASDTASPGHSWTPPTNSPAN
jgi:hypothetical protein